jgi:hypothetical protein
MAVVDKNNIALGIGNVEFGSYSTAGAFIGYTDIGAIKTEVNMEHNREVKEFETGRPLVIIKQEVIRESVILKFTFAELNLGTIKSTLGQGVITTSVLPTFLDGSSTALSGTLQTGTTSVMSGALYKFGGLPTLTTIGIRFTHVKSNGMRQVFEGYIASPKGTLTLPFKETDWNLFEATFQLLANTALPAGQQYYQFFIEGNPTTDNPIGS